MSAAGNIRWSQVRERIQTNHAALRDALIHAPIADVPKLQGKAQAYAEIIDWFENGAIRDLEMTLQHASPTTP